MSCIALWLAERSLRDALGERIGSLRETEAERWLDGEEGGGMDALLDRRARGVVIVLVRVGVPVGGPMVPAVLRPALGVNGDEGARGGDVRDAGTVGEAILLADVGLLIIGLVGLFVPVVRLLSCFAVIPTYLDAREPGVMIGSTTAVLGSGTVLLGVVVGLGRVLADPPGVRLPIEVDGVILPDCDAGVIRPLGSEDVFLPFALIDDENEGVTLPDNEGVTRPLRLEAAEEGLEIDPAAGTEGESLEVAMNTPQFGGQVKYRFLYRNVSHPTFH